MCLRVHGTLIDKRFLTLLFVCIHCVDIIQLYVVKEDYLWTEECATVGGHVNSLSMPEESVRSGPRSGPREENVTALVIIRCCEVLQRG